LEVNPNTSWKNFTAISSSIFFAAIVALTTYLGTSSNSLHTSAQAWSFAGLFIIIGSVLGIAAFENYVSRK
jgi:hypothetical protein